MSEFESTTDLSLMTASKSLAMYSNTSSILFFKGKASMRPMMFGCPVSSRRSLISRRAVTFTPWSSNYLFSCCWAAMSIHHLCSLQRPGRSHLLLIHYSNLLYSHDLASLWHRWTFLVNSHPQGVSRFTCLWTALKTSPNVPVPRTAPLI